MNNIDCSVIIPAYNAEKSIIKCLNSFELSNDKYKNTLEIIVVNDGSSDKTESIATQYLKDFCNCKVISKKNGGVSSARNVGIGAAEGKYIYFCDSDDMVIRDTLDQMITTADNINCDIIIAQYLHNSNRGIVKGTDSFETNVLLNREYIIKNVLSLFVLENGPASLWNKLYRNKLITENGISFDECRSHGEDWAFNIDYFSIASNMYVIDKAVYNYIQDGTQGDFEKYGKNVGFGLIEGQKKIFELNNKYHFFEEDSFEIKNAKKRFISLCIGYLELKNITVKEKLKFLSNKYVKDALNILIKLKPNELPGWTRKNHFAILLLKLKLYKILIWLHYLFGLNMIPSIKVNS